MDGNIVSSFLLSSFNSIYLIDIINDKINEYYYDSSELRLRSSSDFLAFLDDRKKYVHPDDFNGYFDSVSMKKLESSLSNGNDAITYKYRLRENGIYKNYVNIIRLVNYNNYNFILVLSVDIEELEKQSISTSEIVSDNSLHLKLIDITDTVSDVILKIYNSINMSNINTDNQNNYVYDYISTLLDELNKKFPEFNKQLEKNLISQVNKTKNTIFIIDDDVMTRTLLKKAFQDDYEIVEATNGKEAIDILDNPNASINYIDDVNAIFLDIAMPIMDGFSVLDYLRTNNILRKIPVIIISAAEQKETREKVYKYNVADMLEKPFNLEVIKYRTKNFISLYKTSNSLNQLILSKNIDLINTIEVLSKSLNTNLIYNIELLYSQVLEDNKSLNLSSKTFKSNIPLHVEIATLLAEYNNLLKEGSDRDTIINAIYKKENTKYSSTVLDSFRKLIDKL